MPFLSPSYKVHGLVSRCNSDQISRMPKNFHVRLVPLAWLFIAFLGNNPVQGADTAFYGIIKGQTFFQSATFATTADGSSNVVFRVLASPTGPNTLTNANVKVQANPAVALSFTNGLFTLQRFFSTTNALDAAFPNGNYTVTMQTVNDGTKSGILSLIGNNYPATPRFINFTSAQTVDPTANFTLNWSLSNGSAIDYLQLLVFDCRSNLVFSTAGPGESTALNGLSTTALIPGRTLRAGHNYSAMLLALRPIDNETNSYPGSVGVAGYYKQLRMPLITTGTSAGCANGHFHLEFNFPVGSFSEGTNSTISFPLGVSNYFGVFTIENESSPATTAYFTGPASSSLNNTTNSSPAQLSGLTATYKTPTINTPSFPGAGIYTVQYKGTSNSFNLLSPNASSQQILLMPTVTVNASNVLKKINWTYKTTNGTTTTSQSYMHHIEVRVDGFNGVLYKAGDDGSSISTGTNSHTLSQSVLWSEVKGIQLLFVDTPGNRYISYWSRASATPPTLSAATYMGSGQFSFLLDGSPGQNYAIEASSNLLNWVSLFTTNSQSGDIQIKQTNAANVTPRYYRAVIAP